MGLGTTAGTITNMWQRAVGVGLGFWMAACASIGPGTVPRDRVDYVNAIGTSWEQETLLNVVKLRYGHAPIFFSVTEIVSGYQFQSTVTAGLVASNFTPNTNIFGLAGTAATQGQYTDRPTIIYTPLTGVDFLQTLLKPIRGSIGWPNWYAHCNSAGHCRLGSNRPRIVMKLP